MCIGKDRKQSRLVVEDSDRRRRILARAHNDHHFGLHRTNDLVSKKYYWPGLYKDVNAFVSINARSIVHSYVGLLPK